MLRYCMKLHKTFDSISSQQRMTSNSGMIGQSVINSRKADPFEFMRKCDWYNEMGVFFSFSASISEITCEKGLHLFPSALLG